MGLWLFVAFWNCRIFLCMPPAIRYFDESFRVFVRISSRGFGLGIHRTIPEEMAMFMEFPTMERDVLVV